MTCCATTECPICMDTIQTSVNCVITECGHTFHTRCLLTNIVHNGFGCPYCRADMVPEELFNEADDDSEPNEHDIAFVVEDDEDEENGRDDDDADNWIMRDMDRNVTLRRRQMNRLRMYERSHSAMRLMFARMEDETASPEDVEFDDYSTIASDNFSFDDEDDEDYALTVSDSDDSSSEEENEVADEETQESNRAFVNHLPNVSQISYSLERAEYTVHDFVRLLLSNEYPQYSSIISQPRAENTHSSLTRFISSCINRYQERIYPTRAVSIEEAEDAQEDDDAPEEDEDRANVVEIRVDLD